MTARKPSAAVQRRAEAQQESAPVEAPPSRHQWLCGGCGDTIRVGFACLDNDMRIAYASPLAGEASLAFAVACREPVCDVVVVRCRRCGGAWQAHQALAHHTCRAVRT